METWDFFTHKAFISTTSKDGEFLCGVEDNLNNARNPNNVDNRNNVHNPNNLQARNGNQVGSRDQVVNGVQNPSPPYVVAPGNQADLTTLIHMLTAQVQRQDT